MEGVNPPKQVLYGKPYLLVDSVDFLDPNDSKVSSKTKSFASLVLGSGSSDVELNLLRIQKSMRPARVYQKFRICFKFWAVQPMHSIQSRESSESHEAFRGVSHSMTQWPTNSARSSNRSPSLLSGCGASTSWTGGGNEGVVSFTLPASCRPVPVRNPSKGAKKVNKTSDHLSGTTRIILYVPYVPLMAPLALVPTFHWPGATLPAKWSSQIFVESLELPQRGRCWAIFQGWSQWDKIYWFRHRLQDKKLWWIHVIASVFLCFMWFA